MVFYGGAIRTYGKFVRVLPAIVGLFLARPNQLRSVAEKHLVHDAILASTNKIISVQMFENLKSFRSIDGTQRHHLFNSSMFPNQLKNLELIGRKGSQRFVEIHFEDILSSNLTEAGLGFVDSAKSF